MCIYVYMYALEFRVERKSWVEELGCGVQSFELEKFAGMPVLDVGCWARH